VTNLMYTPDTMSALVMSSDVSILATCPKNRSCLVWMSSDSCGGEYSIKQMLLYRIPCCVDDDDDD